MDITERDILIWISSLGIGNSNIEKIRKYFYDLKEFWECNNNQILAMNDLRQNVKQSIIHNRNQKNIDELFEKLKKQNIDIITIFDENYPVGLRYIDDKPNVLYLKGNLIAEDQLAIAVVGSRKATSYGKWACEKFTKELVDLGVTIISGLATGIDTVAHKTAIEQKGRTIGVLGNGLDIVYPRRNSNLYIEVAENGGVISEFPLGTEPFNYNFPQRNRIISGLALGIVVIEAQVKSGSLITAHYGLDQGKDVFALPGNINSVFSGGTNKLIKDGAKPLLELDDILEEISELQLKFTSNKKANLDYSNFSETEIKIIKALEESPKHIDIIVHETGVDISTLSSMLTILELKSAIIEVSGGVFMIN